MAYSFFLHKSTAVTIALEPLTVVVTLAAPAIPIVVVDDPTIIDVENTYGTLAGADAYFSARLHEEAWSEANPTDRPKALWAATLIIDALNYKGYKATVYNILYDADGNELDVTDEEIRGAEASQSLEFPRGEDTEVPEAVHLACYEIAYSLLDGKDPELELENLGIISQGFGTARSTYARSQTQIEHIINGVPNAQAWNRLKTFLRDADAIKLSRAD